MCHLSFEETEICRKFTIPDGSIRQHCINRYQTSSDQVIYIDNQLLCSDSNCKSCIKAWTSDYSLHTNHNYECKRCTVNRMIFFAQVEFCSLYLNMIISQPKLSRQYHMQKLGSTLFGGIPYVRFKEMRYIMDKVDDFDS